jgi:hypothetical protein
MESGEAGPESMSDEDIEAEADELEKEWDDAAQDGDSSSSLMPWLVPILLIAGFLLIVLLLLIRD